MDEYIDIQEHKRLCYGRSVEALSKVSQSDLEEYFDGWHILKPALANKHNINVDRIIIGDGIKAILKEIFDGLSSNDGVVTSKLCYKPYIDYSARKNIHPEFFEVLKDTELGFRFDIEQCISKIKNTNPKLLLIASPNNPTGNVISSENLEQILLNTKPETLVVLDEAFYGYNQSYSEPDFIGLLEKYPNLIILRSFSKYYNLAGIRVGYGLCGENVIRISNIEQRRLGGNKISERLALEALKNERYYKELSFAVISNRAFLISNVNKSDNFKAFQSLASFVVIEFIQEIGPKLQEYISDAPAHSYRFISDNQIKVNVHEKLVTEWFVCKLLEIDSTIKNKI